MSAWRPSSQFGIATLFDAQALAERSVRGKAPPMKVAVLETGRPPGRLADQYGDYPTMFERLLGEGFQIQPYDVAAGKLPTDPADHLAYLITGSPAGVYDPLSWIGALQE